MRTLISILLVAIGFASVAQVYNRPLKEGNELYDEGKYDEAEIRYRDAIKEKKEDVQTRGRFNLGDALYKQERFEEAAEEFSGVAALTDDESLKSKALHNLGNSYLQQQKPQEAIDAYKNALKLNPKDEETRHNLTRAMRQLQQQQQQDQDEDQQDQDEQQQQEGNQEDQDQQEGDQQQDQQRPDEPGDEQGEQPRPKEGEISRQDAERLLEMLNRQEEDVQKKLNEEKMKGKPAQTEKDW